MECGVTGQNIQSAMLLVMVVSKYEVAIVQVQLMVVTYVNFLTVNYLLKATMKKSVYHATNFLVMVSVF